MEKIDRRRFLKHTLLVSGAAALGFAGIPTRSSGAILTDRRPNILFIISDDHGWGDLPANWASTNVQMPVLDNLAQEGIRFTDFHTEPLCGPSRACLFTGQYSMENGMWRGPSATKYYGDPTYRGIKRNVTMLSEYLHKTGYTTGCFGKWHMGFFEDEVPNDRGFDEFYGFLSGSHTYQLTPGDSAYLHNKEQYCESAHATDYITDKALDFINATAGGENPFFCYVSYNAVHGPLWRTDNPTPSAPQEWLDKAAARGIDFPRRDYVATLEHMDYSIGRILQQLDDLHIEEDTMVLFVSDNGAITFDNEEYAPKNYPGNNGPFRGGKATTYQGGIAVPFIMRWNNVFPEGIVSDQIAMHCDVFSTLLDVAWLPIPTMNGYNPVRGISLVPHVISGAQQPLPERSMIFELWGNIGLRKGKYKLWGQITSNKADWEQHVIDLQNTDLQLFDLSQDIGETTDLRTDLPYIYDELKEELINFFSNINAEYPPGPYPAKCSPVWNRFF